MNYSIPLVLIVVHFVADFVLQTDWQAKNKSKNWNALLRHVAVYSLCFAWWGWAFVAITFLTHAATDAVTSRINSHLWQKQQVHYFFVGVGADQMIHYFTLAFTYRWLVG